MIEMQFVGCTTLHAAATVPLPYSEFYFGWDDPSSRRVKRWWNREVLFAFNRD